mgnify:CR=1 FL=1
MKQFAYTFTLLYIFIFCVLNCKSQTATGVGTRNPQGVFHIDGRKDNAKTGLPTLTQVANDFILTTDGWVGIGNISPRAKMDLRSDSVRNAIGLGSTTLSAAEAGAGAMRYYSYSGGSDLQYSDGKKWVSIFVTPQKASVIAQLRTAKTIPAKTETIIDNWTELEDITSSFNPSTGAFTAPRDGVYTFVITLNFVNGSIISGSYIQIQFVDANNSTSVKVLRSFGESSRNSQGGIALTSTIMLAKGAVVMPQVYYTFLNSGSRALRIDANQNNPNGGFNNLMIIEH